MINNNKNSKTNNNNRNNDKRYNIYVVSLRSQSSMIVLIIF